MHMRRKAIHSVMGKHPFVKMFAPVDFSPIEIFLNFGYGLSLGHLVRCIHLKKSAIGFEKTVVLTIAPVSPRAAGHEVRFIGQPHQLLEKILKCISIRPEESVLELLLVVGLLKVHELELSLRRACPRPRRGRGWHGSFLEAGDQFAVGMTSACSASISATMACCVARGGRGFPSKAKAPCRLAHPRPSLPIHSHLNSLWS